MKVREVLEPLRMGDLKRLCQLRGRPYTGSKDEILTRLACSYRGDLEALVRDLRKKDLLRIASGYSDSVEFPERLRRFSAPDLRDLCLAVFKGRYRNPEGSSRVATEEEGHFRLALFASGCGGLKGIEDINERSLEERAAAADSVTILSAYYVPEVLETIAGACRGDVKIVLNGLGGRRLSTQVQELEELQAKLRDRSQSAKIRLAFAEGLFHSKLYLFGSGRDAVAWIGSANATKAGLNGRNEEVLAQIAPAPRSVVDYIDSAWSRATPIEQCRQKVTSLITFFRTGMLYYKPYATLQMTLNPFRTLMESLPVAEKLKISRFRSDYADEEAGIGAFNLNRVYQRLLQGKEREQPVKRQRVQIRRYAIETCYGHWVAEPYIEKVDKKLIKASAERRRRLKSIRKWMKRHRDDHIVRAYSSYLKDVKTTLEVEEVEWSKYAAPDLFEDTSTISRRVDALVTTLAPSGIDRHCQAFVTCAVPEIWEDNMALKSFEDTFFDSLARASSTRKCGAGAKRILAPLKLSDVTAEE
ncbi:MAG: NgoFVII family restriction endonuclease, partial [Alphaproteobacteria bacterium]|nr:NgoFVII family restriction endonuclease [Alphaproteobacteria bacterium]